MQAPGEVGGGEALGGARGQGEIPPAVEHAQVNFLAPGIRQAATGWGEGARGAARTSRVGTGTAGILRDRAKPWAVAKPQAQPGEIAGALAHANSGNVAELAAGAGQKRVQGRQQMHQKSARGVDDMFRQHPVIVQEGQAALIAGGIQGQQQQGGYWRVANRRMMS